MKKEARLCKEKERKICEENEVEEEMKKLPEKRLKETEN